MLKIPRSYSVSLYKPKAVYAASEWQYTAAGGDVQVPMCGIYVLRKAEPQEIGTRIGKANAVLREFYRSVATKRELSNTAKLSVFKSIVVPILTYGRESERLLSQLQAPKMGFLRSPRCDKGTYRGYITPGARNKFGASIFEPKVF